VQHVGLAVLREPCDSRVADGHHVLQDDVQAFGPGALVDRDLLVRAGIAPVDEDQLGAAGIALDPAIEDEVAVAARNEPVQFVR